MVAGEWRALTLASEGWPGLVSPTSSSPKLDDRESPVYFFSKTVLDEKSCSYILLILLLDENE